MSRLQEKHKKILSLAAVAVLVIFFALITVFLGKPLMTLFEDPEIFRSWVEEKGWGARLIFVGMVILQILVALIPGEPLEIAAGLAFGAVEGTVLCMVGIAVGSLLVFQFVRYFGVKLVEVFFPVEKIHSLRFLQNSRRVDIVLFLLMLIPGTPKDLISYFVGLTPMNLWHWVILTTVARIPSVVTSTVGGNALGTGQIGFAIWVFAVSLAISLGGVGLYQSITKRRAKKEKRSQEDQ